MSADVPNIDIRPDHWAMVQDILQKHVPQYEVWAFGSRAKWTAKDHSDLDLCIKTDKPLDFKTLALMEEDFSESDLPWKVDVVDWATTSESFRKIIERDKVVVQKAGRGVVASETRSLDSICELIVDCPHSTPVWTDSGYIVIRNQNIKNGQLDLSAPSFTDAEHFSGRNRRAKPTAGDIVITREAPMGEVCMIPEGLECCIGQRQVLLRPNAKIANPRFVLYALQSQSVQHQIGWNEGTGSTVSNLRIPLLKALEIPLPHLAEQHAIAETLGALDDRIANLRQTNATLQAIASALFKSRFVDFDGVPPEDMQESELGAIPKGWRAGTLGEAFEINPKRELKKGTVAPYLDMASLPTAGAVPDMPVPREFSSGTKFTNGDTLLARITPCLENGKTAFVDFLEQGQVGWGSTEFIVLRPKPPLPPFFGYLLARRADFREHAIRAMSGTSGRQRTEVSQLHNFTITLPDEATASAFAAFIEPLQKNLFANEAQAATLATLRDTLLPRLISGRLKLPQASLSQPSD